MHVLPPQSDGWGCGGGAPALQGNRRWDQKNPGTVRWGWSGADSSSSQAGPQGQGHFLFVFPPAEDGPPSPHPRKAHRIPEGPLSPLSAKPFPGTGGPECSSEEPSSAARSPRLDSLFPFPVCDLGQAMVTLCFLYTL